MVKTKIFSPKGVLGIFAAITFLAGFFLLDNGSFTGNAVLSEGTSFNPIAMVGLTLIVCSAVLAFFSLKKD